MMLVNCGRKKVYEIDCSLGSTKLSDCKKRVNGGVGHMQSGSCRQEECWELS